MADVRTDDLIKALSVNDRMLDRGIRHALFLERLKTREVDMILRFLNSQVLPDIRDKLAGRLDRIKVRGFDTGPHTTKSIRAMLESVNGLMSAGLRSASKRLANSLRSIAITEAQFQVAVMAEAVPFDFNFRTPSPATLRSVVVSRPFQGRLLREWWQSVDQRFRADFRSQVQIGITTGESTQQITRRVFGERAVVGKTRRQVEAVVRTAVNHTTTHARESTYDANADIIKQVRYVATLDHRTTEQCMLLDGRIFNINEGERPPVHMKCRSTTVPVLKGADELNIPGLNNLPPAQRASMSGNVPATITYPEWLKRQSAEIQNLALGKTKAKLFREGKLTIDRFVDDRGRSLSLAELRRREGLT